MFHFFFQIVDQCTNPNKAVFAYAHVIVLVASQVHHVLLLIFNPLHAVGCTIGITIWKRKTIYVLSISIFVLLIISSLRIWCQVLKFGDVYVPGIGRLDWINRLSIHKTTLWLIMLNERYMFHSIMNYMDWVQPGPDITYLVVVWKYVWD